MKRSSQDNTLRTHADSTSVAAAVVDIESTLMRGIFMACTALDATFLVQPSGEHWSRYQCHIHQLTLQRWPDQTMHLQQPS